MLCIYRKQTEQILGTYLQYADHIQCIHRPTLLIRVKGRKKTEEKKKKKRVVPRAAAAYGRQLKSQLCAWRGKAKLHINNFITTSSPKSRSQTILWVSITRMYPHSGYFLVFFIIQRGDLKL